MAISADIMMRIYGAKAAESEMAKLSDKADEIEEELEKASKSADDLADSARDADLSLEGAADSAGGVAALSILAIGGLAKLALEAGETAVQADNLATALDTSVERASVLAAGFDTVGVEADDVVDLALQVSEALQDDAELMEKLGINAAQAQDPVTALKAGIDGWDLLKPTQRMKLFGEEGVTQVAAITAKGIEFEEWLAGFDGQIITPEDVEQARDMQAETADLKAKWEEVSLVLGQKFMPVLADAANTAGNLAGDEGLWGAAKASYDLVATATGLNLYKDVLLGIGEAAGVGTGEVVDLADATRDLVPPTDAAGRRLQALADSFTDVGTEGTDGTGAAVDGLTDVERAAKDAKDAVTDWKDSLDVEKAAGKMAASMLTAIGGTREEMAQAERDTIAWIKTLEDVPKELITELRASFSDGSLAEIYSDIEAIRRAAGEPVALNYYVPQTAYGRGPDGGSVPRSTGTTVNITMAGQPSSRELASQVAYWESHG